MPARRFFVEGTHAVGDVAVIDGSDAHKIRNVLRLRDGDTVEIADSAGRVFDGILHGSSAKLVREIEASFGRRFAVDLAQAIPKAPKMDFVVEKATELGARTILPFVSERVIARKGGVAKRERWSRLARSASQQSGRATIAQIDSLLTFDALCERFSEYGAVLFPWELAPQIPLRDMLPQLIAHARSILVVIGPEGGFSHDEAERAVAAGAALLWLGPRILRSETAGMVVLSILQYLD
jgi:16S rRNA (uracil1498-N3)-methyltransferase